MYCGRCPAKRGAVAKPFTSVSCHQVQFRTAAGSPPPASVGTIIMERIASNAIFHPDEAAIFSLMVALADGGCVAISDNSGRPLTLLFGTGSGCERSEA